MPISNQSCTSDRNAGHRLETLFEQAEELTASDLVRESAKCFGDGLVMTTSFGAQSAVMLHMVTCVVPEIPVIWIDTGYLFPETYRFADELTNRLELNLHVFQSPVSPARMEALHGKLWQSDEPEVLDHYDQLRKVEPMHRAIRDFGVRGWLAGLRRDQTEFRRSLPRVQTQRDFHKIFPILNWSNRDLHAYLVEHDLPYHPLFDRGYVSIGDWHASEPLTSEHVSERDTRYRGIKQECGLHLELSDEADESLRSSRL